METMLNGYGLFKNSWLVDSRLGVTQLKLLLLLSSLTSAKGSYTIDVNQLADYLLLSDRTIKSAINSLVKIGYIKVTNDQGEKVLRLQNVTDVVIKKDTKLDVVIDDELVNEFHRFHASFKGKKRGVNVEFNDFKRKHRNIATIIPMLHSAHQNELKMRKINKDNNIFIPEIKHLSTWLNKSCWEYFDQVTDQVTDQVEDYIINAYKSGYGHLYSYRDDHEKLLQDYGSDNI